MNEWPVKLGPVVPATVCDEHDMAAPKHCAEAFAPPPPTDEMQQTMATLLHQSALRAFQRIFHGI